jgi:cytoskeletal protein RodZ
MVSVERIWNAVALGGVVLALLVTAGVISLGDLPSWIQSSKPPESPAQAEAARKTAEVKPQSHQPPPSQSPAAPPAVTLAAPSSPPPSGEPASSEPPAPAGAPAVPRPLQATLTSPDGPDPLLRVQDEIRAVLVTTGEAFAYCYYADGAGSISRIFPNRFRPDALVPSGGLQLPDAAGAFSLVAERAGRTEEVRCLAARSDLGSRLPPVLQAEDLAPLAVRSLDEISSMFKSLGEEVAEARLVARVAP